ncbi:MAG TPA: CmpA/NrtA family ABC transporter substrate-binding protein [Candidatus Didemnitutus sp.]|nr:CmpA/NrtA family ABC transporter substrate-binding protein [Candidatus Didemnitutus sp.]
MSSPSKTPPPSASTPSPASPERRAFLKQGALLAGSAALFAALGNRSWAATAASVSDAPETPDVKFGIIALTDCSPIVIAHEKGFFKKYGIRSKISKEASWAVIRDRLATGDNQATHMLIGMPYASSMGLLGSPKKPMVYAWMLNRNGQAITLKKAYRGKVAADASALKPFVDEAKKDGKPLTFAMTFPPGTHAMWMRYWLASGGIHPGDAAGAGADINLITIPPPQMVSNMRVGKMDGFCVGEPWNARAIDDGIGYTATTTQDMWADHPEKVCAFTAEFAEKNPKTVKAILKALHDASVWLDNLDNRSEQSDIVSQPAYINCPKEIILGRLLGEYDYGDGRKKKDPRYMSFSARNCNYPQPKYGTWWLTQFRRWGMVTGAPDYAGIVKQVCRDDLYAGAMKELGVGDRGRDDSAFSLFDGKSFDPAGDLESYAKGFAINALKG